MKYKLAIFDMDGTILDTLGDLTDSCNHTMSAFQFPTHDIEAVRGFVGNGIARLIDRAVPAGTDEAIKQKMVTEFLSHYQQHCDIKTKPYDGILELLTALRKESVLTAVVSNKADAAVQKLCAQYFPQLFDCAKGECAGIAKKPAPDMTELVLATLGIDKKDAIYIGDSDVDIATAKNAGLDGIFVSWGFRSAAFLKEKGASIIVDTPMEILPYVMGRM